MNERVTGPAAAAPARAAAPTRSSSVSNVETPNGPGPRLPAPDPATLALVADHTHNAVVITDAAGRIVWVNPGFTRITGYDPAEVLGRTPGSFLQGPGTDPDTVAAVTQALAWSREAVTHGQYVEQFAEVRAFALGLEPPPQMLLFEWDILTGDSAVLDVLYAVARDSGPDGVTDAIADGQHAIDVATAMRDLVAGTDAVVLALIEMTDGRGPDSVVEAVGMEAHGSPAAKAAQTAVGLLPDTLAKPLIDRMAVDRLDECGVYFGTTGGQVYCSPNGGDTWDAVVRDLPAVLSVEVQTLS